jgi:carbonic anhydrase
VVVPGMKITLNLEPGAANANTTLMAKTLASAMSNPTSTLSSGEIMGQLDKSRGMSMGSVDANSDCANIAKKWDYKDAPAPGGPSMWKKTYSKCGQPKQSPIRLPVTPPKSAKTVLRRLDFDYKLDTATLMNDGRALMAMVPPGSTFRVSGDSESDATLQYAVMHSPSEHVFTDDQGNDIRYAAELQLHHRTPKGLIKVVSILFSINAPNPFMDDLLGTLPAKCASGTSKKTIKFEDALPFSRSYYMYYGTLTSPPCTESVTWYVMREQGTMSLKQLEKFRKAFNLDVKKPPGSKTEKMGVHDIQVIDKNKYPSYQFSETLMGDVRPLQPMDNRKLWTTPAGM